MLENQYLNFAICFYTLSKSLLLSRDIKLMKENLNLLHFVNSFKILVCNILDSLLFSSYHLDEDKGEKRIQNVKLFVNRKFKYKL